VFLCHAKENKKEVRGLYRTLLDVGAQPWLDDEDVLPGQDWEYEIQRAMSECDAILVCLSRSSVAKRGFVQTEIRKAIELAGKQPEGCIFIIPVRFEECEIPSQLSRWQSVDLYCEGANERLFRALELRRRLAARYASRPGVR
jgi:hypothetical protein